MARSSGGGRGDPHTGQGQQIDGRNSHSKAAGRLWNKAMPAVAAGKRDHSREKRITATLRGGRKRCVVPSVCCFLRKPWAHQKLHNKKDEVMYMGGIHH